MASDLGAKDLIILDNKNAHAVFTYFELYRPATSSIMDYGHNGTFAGSVDDNGTPLEKARIRVYHSPSGKQLARGLTDANGDFSIEGFDENVADFFIIAENDGDQTLIYNDVQPVVV
jgi:hypothetical protein